VVVLVLVLVLAAAKARIVIEHDYDYEHDYQNEHELSPRTSPVRAVNKKALTRTVRLRAMTAFFTG
jgi:hypothetical protein